MSIHGEIIYICKSQEKKAKIEKRSHEKSNVSDRSKKWRIYKDSRTLKHLKADQTVGG